MMKVVALGAGGIVAILASFKSVRQFIEATYKLTQHKRIFGSLSPSYCTQYAHHSFVRGVSFPLASDGCCTMTQIQESHRAIPRES